MLPSDKTVTIKHFLFQGEHFEKNVAFAKIRLKQKTLCNVQNSICYLYVITECGDNKQWHAAKINYFRRLPLIIQELGFSSVHCANVINILDAHV